MTKEQMKELVAYFDEVTKGMNLLPEDFVENANQIIDSNISNWVSGKAEDAPSTRYGWLYN